MSTGAPTVRGLAATLACALAALLIAMPSPSESQPAAVSRQVRPPAEGSRTAVRVCVPCLSRPAPLAVFVHGRNGDQRMITADPHYREIVRDLLAAGFIVAAPTLGNSWGSDAAVDELVGAVDEVKAGHDVSDVVMVGESMGGLASLRAVTEGRLRVSAWLGVYPATNLQGFRRPDFVREIQRAHGREPRVDDGVGLPGVRFLFLASPDDTVVPKTLNTDEMAEELRPVARSVRVVETRGEHGDASNFERGLIVRFLVRSGLTTARRGM